MKKKKVIETIFTIIIAIIVIGLFWYLIIEESKKEDAFIYGCDNECPDNSYYRNCSCMDINEFIEEYTEEDYNLTAIEEWIEEMENKCWEKKMTFCNRFCSEEVGLVLTNDSFSYDTTQFDTDNDGNFSEEEIAESDYVNWRFQRCIEPCVEKEVYPCFRMYD